MTTIDSGTSPAPAAATGPMPPPRPERGPPVIELEDLSVHFGRVKALDGLTGSFSARSIGLLGPNGAGKTTLIHTLLGFHAPCRGSCGIKWDAVT